MLCSVEGCGSPHYAKSWCRHHWFRMRVYGRLEKIRGLEKGPCAVEGCTNKADVKGLCPVHYQRQNKFGRLYKIRTGDKGQHPLYNLWAERHANRDLCDDWMDFGHFVDGVIEKPGVEYFLVKIDYSRPYGPDNFKWQTRLKREPGESKKAWHARKWASRRTNYPNYEANRWLKRKYGITQIDYDRMKGNQGNLCAICQKSETAFDSKTHAVRGLAVDHCHTTKKVRGLLCFRCNSVIGSLRDSIELLDACRKYLIEHQEATHARE